MPAIPRLILAGGRPRNDMADEIERERVELNGKDELNAIQWQRMRQMADVRPRSAPESADQEIERLRARAAMLTRELEQAGARGGDPRPGREEVMAEFQRELAQVEQLIEAVRADAAGPR